MTKIKLKPVEPLSKQAFQLYALKLLCFRLVFLAIIAIALEFLEIDLDGTTTYYVLGALVGLDIFFVASGESIHKYRARYKDIYPDHELGRSNYLLWVLIPFAYLGFTVFLCLKEGNELAQPKWIFKTRYAVLSLIPFAALQILSPKFSYWSASPTMYYLVDLSHDTSELMSVYKNAEYRKDLVEDFQRLHPEKLSSTQLILILVVNSQLILKEKNRSIASGTIKSEAGIESGFDAAEACYKVLLAAENTKPDFFDFSPVQWLHPSGTIEILLLAVVDNQILKKLKPTLIQSSMKILDTIEANIVSEPSIQKKEKIKALRIKFQQTKTYRSIASQKGWP